MEHLRITVAGQVYNVIVEKIEDDSATSTSPPVAPSPSPAPAAPAAAPRLATPPPAVKSAAGAGDTTSPLAGIVQAIELQVGAAVKAGDAVVTLEAMKMYTAINAVASGTLTAIHVKVGDAVEEGQVLYTIS